MDRIDRVFSGTVGIQLTDFRVPVAGFDGKLGMVGYDGEVDGSQVRFGRGTLSSTHGLSDAKNPRDRRFNGTRSSLGRAVSVVGDLPQTSAGAAHARESPIAVSAP